MAKKQETALQQKIKKHLQSTFGGRWWKTHGSMFQESGIGDLIGCCNGYYFNLEVKRPDNKDRPDHQAREIDVINSNGGCASFVTSPEEAEDVVRTYLNSKAVVIPKRSILGSSKKRKTRSMVRPGDREDSNSIEDYYTLVE